MKLGGVFQVLGISFLLVVFCSETYGQESKEITVELTNPAGNRYQQIGIGFEKLQEQVGSESWNLKLNILAPRLPTGPKVWQITSSQKHDPEGKTLWLPPEIKTPAREHSYAATGIIANQLHSIRVSGTLEFPGRSASKPPLFDVMVAQVDIDMDTTAANRHLPGWPPTGEDEEDKIEAIRGIFLPSGMISKETFPPEITEEIQKQKKIMRVKIWTSLPASSSQQKHDVGTMKIEFPAGIGIYKPKEDNIEEYFLVDNNTTYPLRSTALNEDWYIVTNKKFEQSGYIRLTFSWDRRFVKAKIPHTSVDTIRVAPLSSKGTIRFIRQDNTSIPSEGDDACLMISKRKTDIDINNPSTADFEGPVPPRPDPDTFRVELLEAPQGLDPPPKLRVIYPSHEGEGKYASATYEMVEGTVGNNTVYRSRLHIRLVATAADDTHLDDQTLRVRLGDSVKAECTWTEKGIGYENSAALPIARPPEEDGPNAIRTADLRFVVFGNGITAEEIQNATRFTSNVWSQAAIRFHIVETVFVENPVKNILTVTGKPTEDGQVRVTVQNTQVSISVTSQDTTKTVAQKLASAISEQAKLKASAFPHYDGDQNDKFEGWIVLVNKGHNVNFANPQHPQGVRIGVPRLDFSSIEDGNKNKPLKTLELACLSLNYKDKDYDDATIDVFVVGKARIKDNLSGMAGGDCLADRIPAWHNVVFVQAYGVDAEIPTYPFLLAHELGHVLLDGDDTIHQDDTTNLMHSPVSEIDSVGATKRLTPEQHNRAREKSGPGSAGPVLLKKK